MKLRSKKKYLLSGRRSLFRPSFVIAFFLLLTGLLGFFTWKNLNNSAIKNVSKSNLYTYWDEGNYSKVYDDSGMILEIRPLDGEVLALRGFSAYYLFLEQTDSHLSQLYLTDSIHSLRNAWYRVSESERPHIAYILGKAYYQRGYYYADLALFYLQYAKSAGLQFEDLSEFLALSFSLLGDHASSIEAFAKALTINPSDLLLYSLSQSYLKQFEYEKAEQYLLETIRISEDELLRLKCHNLLGLLYFERKDMPAALKEFETILEKDVNSADAHYGLGVIYEAQGDLIKARSEWRKAVKADPVHSGARQKLNL